MMDLGQLMAASLRCQTRAQALELVRRETAATLRCFEGLTEQDARTKVLGSIAYVTGTGMTRDESARVMRLFEVAHPYFGGDVDQWPTAEEIARPFCPGQALRERLARR